MKIGIDATKLAQPRIVGISRFVANLIEELAVIDTTSEFYLCYRPRALEHPTLIRRPGDARFHVRILQKPLNFGLFRRLDVFHATYQHLPSYRDSAPYLGTLHDIFYLTRPDMGTEATRARWISRYRDTAERSRLIMTLSEFSRDEIVKHLNVPRANVRVVPLAASAEYAPQPANRIAEVRAQFGLAAPYILFGGGFGRRKNPVRAVQAFATAASRLAPDVCLAMTGVGGPMEAETRAAVRDARLESRVKFLGFIGDADHPALMAGSVVYFFPSELEGFGLPPLEAMSCGAPVVTSTTTSLPEVCENAAILADPSDVQALSAALVEVALDETLRAELRRRGFARAREFTWRRVAEQISALYREIAEV